MLLKWIPWKFLIRRTARAYGFLDPITWLAKMRRFSQPSEVTEPLDLIRAGIVFHARGLINTQAIQHNLDWVWPFWVERQFKPGDVSFIPRAFSLSHVNLTHRNWTAVGLPDFPLYPLVDPRGLVTPLYGGWSIDTWLLTEGGRTMLPSRLAGAEQNIDLSQGWAVKTHLQDQDMALVSRVFVENRGGQPQLAMHVRGRAGEPGWVIVAVRPYNPEGVQFIYRLALEAPQELRVNKKTSLHFDAAPSKAVFSTYDEGDVYHRLNEEQKAGKLRCPVGMATGALFFPLEKNQNRELRIDIDLAKDLRRERYAVPAKPLTWSRSLEPAARLCLPDEQIQYLYDSALRSLILLSAGSIVPGPFTYRRFWFRDAVMMLGAMVGVNLAERCVEQLEGFFQRQQRGGFFESQEGEWDSNGQVLWLFDRFEQAAPQLFRTRWMDGIIKGAHWIRRKRLVHETGLHAGLLPPGFSAEHLGPNDYYYWDDFWSIAGLKGAGRLIERYADAKTAGVILAAARDLEQATFRSIAGIPEKRSRGAIPAAPYRRMDAGAIGSLAADYPLQLTPANDPRVKATVRYLMDHCFFDGGFFQDMIHSGINAYLTLTIAQTLLRNGDPRYRALMQTVAGLASGTGQWPEAVHPATRGGCMGDGHHGWASAEWINMIRNSFIREEGTSLVIGSGLFEEWLLPGQELYFGPALTRFGSVSVEIQVQSESCKVDLQTHWTDRAPNLVVRMPGFEEKEMTSPSIRLLPRAAAQ